MKKTFLSTLLLALCLQTLHAQTKARVYPDFLSYKSKTPGYEEVSIAMHNVLEMWVDMDFDIISTDENTGYTPIKKRSWLIERNDSLFINCTIIKYKWFAPILYRDDRYLYFRGFMSRLKEHEVQMHIAGRRALNNNAQNNTIANAVLFGASPAIASEIGKDIRMKSARYNYLVDVRTGKVKVLDIPLMQELLEHNPQLNRQYMKEGHPDDPESIIRYLNAAAEE